MTPESPWRITGTPPEVLEEAVEMLYKTTLFLDLALRNAFLLGGPLEAIRAEQVRLNHEVLAKLKPTAPHAHD